MLRLSITCHLRPFVLQSIACNTRFSNDTAGDFSVKNCAFQSFSYAGQGCAICISNSASTFSAYRTIFSACQSSTLGNYLGGGFYFNGYSMVIREVCGMDCSVLTNGQIFWSYATASTSISGLSLVRCSNSTLPGLYQAFWTEVGVVKATQINSSFNTLQRDGCASMYYCPQQLTVSFQASFNCTSLTGIIMHYFYNVPNGYITNSIVSTNTQAGTTYGFVCHVGDASGYLLTYNNSYFFNNNGGPLFDGHTYGSIEVTNCYICGSDSSLSIGNVGTSACVLATSKATVLSVEVLEIGGLACSIPENLPSTSFTQDGRSSIALTSIIFLTSFSMI